MRRKRRMSQSMIYRGSLHKLSQIEYELNILTFGDSYERREIVQDWMTDGEIIALKERLEQLRKEETYGRIEYPNGYAA